MSLTLCVPPESAFGEYIGPRPRPCRERPGDDLFRVTQAIDRRGIDPVHAQLQRAVNGGDGVVVVLFSPGELPSCAANRPGAVADGCNEQIRISELFCFHIIKCSYSHYAS